MANKGKKKQSFMAWAMTQGIGTVYTVLLSLGISIAKWLIIGILFFIAWWESVR